MKKITQKICILFLILLNGTTAASQCWKQVSAGNNMTLAIKNDGTLWAWGRVWGYGNLDTPLQIGTDTDWKIAEAGSLNCLVIKNNGTLWGWGRNQSGELGIGNQTSVATITQIGTDTDWKLVSTYNTTLALKNDGTLWAWGNDNWGQAGVGGNSAPIITPRRVGNDSDRWKSFSNFNANSAGIKIDGTLWIWGVNIHNSPIQISANGDWEKVVAGSGHYLFLKTNGSLWSWGFNLYGQLGLENTTDTQIVTQIGTDIDWGNISAGYFTSYAQKTNKTIWKWGLHEGVNQKTPIQVGIDNDWKTFDAGDDHIMLLKNDDSMWGFGSDYFGQLGNGISLYSQNTPAAIVCAGSLGKNNFDVSSISVYPNPTTGIISISNQDNHVIDKIEIVDILGKTVSVKPENTSRIDISEMTKGVYIFKIYSGENVSINKIIKN